MSLLTNVQEAAGALGQPVPNTIIGNTQGDAVLWKNLVTREGRELAKRHDWQFMVTENTWTTTATEAQASALPTNYDRLPPDPEVWDRTTGQRLTGPLSSRDWQILKGRTITGSSPGWWRLIGNVLNVYPAPSAGSTFALEYITRDWCRNATTGTGQIFWLDDTDVSNVPTSLISLGITWRWLRAKGMDYAEEMATYEREVEKAAARDRGSDILVVGGGSVDPVTDDTWNGTIS